MPLGKCLKHSESQKFFCLERIFHLQLTRNVFELHVCHAWILKLCCEPRQVSVQIIFCLNPSSRIILVTDAKVTTIQLKCFLVPKLRTRCRLCLYDLRKTFLCLGQHIFSKAKVASNKMEHKEKLFIFTIRTVFHAQFQSVFHFVPIVDISSNWREASNWMLENFDHSAQNVVFGANIQNRTDDTMWKELENLCQTTLTSFLAFQGHLSLLNDFPEYIASCNGRIQLEMSVFSATVL